MVKKMLPGDTFHAEWKKDTIEDVFSFLTNNTFSRDKLNEIGGRFQNIHYGDILVKYGYILDCSAEAVPYINSDICIKSCRVLLQDGDIVMADTAEDEAVGKVIELDAVGDRSVLSGLHTIPMRPHANVFERRFLGYYLNSKEYHDQILPFVTGIKVSSISRAAVKKTYVRYPSDPDEQKAIAAALSDVDRLITATEKLIAKKKAIKQGLMQELLTGKRRLPGCADDWEKTSLGKCLAKIVGGGTPSRKIEEYWNGNIPWATVKDFSTFRSDSTQEKITLQGLVNSASHLIPAGTLIIATRMNIGQVSIYNVDVAINQDLKALFPTRNVCAKYLFYLLISLQQEIESLGTGSTVNGIRVEQLRNFEITLPPLLEEQKKIASVLSDADADIEKALLKLDKLMKLKQGMMSELLTGRIRLLERPVVDAHASKPISESSGHNEQFDDAVVISAIVNAFYSPRYPLGRKKIQKLLYLARRYQNASTDGFLKKAAGPYKPSARYSGGERIAVRNHYIQESQSDKGSIFAPGAKIQTALDYSDQWNLRSVIEWLLQNFKFTPVDDLEVLATVDMAICDLKMIGKDINVTTVKSFISHDAQWRDKLNKKYFSDRNIDTAIKKSLALFSRDSL